MNFAVILAAGQSRRTGKINKIFYRIKGNPLIFYTLKIFEKHKQINKIILVARKRDFKRLLSLIKKWDFKKVAEIIEGGEERQDSSFKGLDVAGKLGAKPRDLILFHNGANPLVSSEEINRVIRMTRKYGAALVGQIAEDTVKEINKNGFVVRTYDRRKIFLAQTPQTIEYGLAKRAFKKAIQDKFYCTDDVSLVERMGKPVKIIKGGPKNIKVTYPEDLKFIEKNL